MAGVAPSMSASVSPTVSPVVQAEASQASALVVMRDAGGPSAVVAAGQDAAVVQARADRMSAPVPRGRRPTVGTPSVRRPSSTVVGVTRTPGADEIPAE